MKHEGQKQKKKDQRSHFSTRERKFQYFLIETDEILRQEFN